MRGERRLVARLMPLSRPCRSAWRVRPLIGRYAARKSNCALVFVPQTSHTRRMAHRFTSLQGSIEKLLEAEYFLAGLSRNRGAEFGYNLNAFLGSCRSVTFVLQKSLSGVASFDAWYAAARERMKADLAMRFFLELRNISQHEGPVSFVGGSIPQPPGWTYRFAGNREAVPPALVGRDVATACAEHLAKTARFVEEFRTAFAHHSCIHSALTLEGMEKLGFSLDDVGVLLGLQPGYLDVGHGIPVEEKLRTLRREFDPIDATALQRMARGIFQWGGEHLTFPISAGADLTDDVARLIESGDEAGRNPRTAFLTAIGRRIQEIDED